MSGAGQGGTMAVGSRAAADARRLGQAPMAGGAAAQGEANQMMGEGGGGTPSFPNAGGPGGATATVAVVRREPLRWGTETGEDYVRELMRGSGTATRPATRRGRTRRSSRATSAAARRLARMTPAQRKRMTLNRYRKPPVGYLSFYLLDDRFKLTSGLWKFVTIEDDRARYPVRYYYRPNSPVFLRILAQQPRNSQPRYNRVIGFHSWQEAVLAGYRPDPISKPEPGAQLAYLARIARGPELARYVEFVYAGQVSPRIFTANFNYIRQVERVVVSKAHSRPYLGTTVSQILAAALGDGPPPRTAGPQPAPQLAPMPVGGGMGGPPPGYGGPPSGMSGPPAGYGGPPSGMSGPPAGYGGPPPGMSGPPAGYGGPR
jgi:hypothetical protein